MVTGPTGSGHPVVPGYDIGEPIGGGGFSRVYRARQVSMARDVALKVLTADLLDEDAQRRFQAECLAVGKLSWHPHVVSVFDAGIAEGGEPYLAMELLPGGSFGDRMRTGPVAADEVRRVGLQVSDALEAAHREGILHRDIKPDNLLVGRRGGAELSDFGIAKVLDVTATATGMWAGTPAYAAPEVLMGEPPTAAADVYSLGATLHALLLGRVPYSSSKDSAPGAIVHRILTTSMEPLPGDVPADLARVIARATAKDPTERYGSAQALHDDLAGVVGSTPTRAVGGLASAAAAQANPGDLEPTPNMDQQTVRRMRPGTSPGEPVPEGDEPTGRSRRGPVVAGGVLLVVVLGIIAALVLGSSGSGSDGGGGGTGESPVAVEGKGYSPRSIGLWRGADGRLENAVLNRSGDVLWRRQDGGKDGAWTPFEVIGRGGSGRGAIGVGTTADGRGQVFFVGDGRSLEVLTERSPGSGTWTSPRDLGGSWKPTSAIGVGHTADGRTQVFLIGSTGRLYVTTQTEPDAASWTGFRSLGGRWSPDGEVAVGASADGRTQVFLIGYAGGLYVTEQTAPNGAGWTGYQDLGGDWGQDDPLAVAQTGDRRSQVFLVGFSGDAYVDEQVAVDGSAWSGFSSLGGDWRPGQPLAATTSSTGRSVLVLASSSGRMAVDVQRSYRSDGWSGFTGVGPAFHPAGAVAAAVDADGSTRLMAVGRDGKLHELIGTPDGSTWRSAAPVPVPA